MSGKTKVVTLLGNHEQWLLRTYHDYTRHSWILGMEGLSTVRSYSPGAAADLEEEIGKLGRRIIGERVPLPYHLFFDSLPADHLAFFLSLRPFYRTADAVCVHGGLNPTGGTVEEQQPEQLIWGANGFPDHYQGNDSIIYGHANNPVFDDSGWPHPRIVGRTYGLDTIAEGVLTALRIPDATVFQSRRFS